MLRSLVLVLSIVGCAQSTTLGSDASDASDAGADAPVSHDAGQDVGIDGGRDVGIDAGTDATCPTLTVTCTTDDECACFGRLTPDAIGCCDLSTALCFRTHAMECPRPQDAGPPPPCSYRCTSALDCDFSCGQPGYACVDGGCQPAGT